MIICVCKCISDREIKSAVASGATSYEGLQCSLGVGTQCGSCSCEVKDILQDLKAKATDCPFEKRSIIIPTTFPSESEAPLPSGMNV